MNKSTTNKKRILTRAAVLLLVFAVAFTALPIATSSLTVDAKSNKKKLPKNITLTAAATSYTTVQLSWNKIRSPRKGYAVFRDGACIALLSKKKSSFNDSVGAGTSHTYQIKVIKKKKKGKLKKAGKKSNAVAVATPAYPVTPSYTPPASSGGSTGTTPTVESKEVTDYLGVTRTITSKNINWGKPIYDRTVDGEFDGMIQRNGVTFRVSSTVTTMYNGDLNRLKVETQNEWKSVSTRKFWEGDENKMTRYFIMSTDGKYRIAETGAECFTKSVSYENEKASCKEAALNITDNTHGCGFVDDSIKINVSYDFNGDGDTVDAGEQIKSVTYTVKADTDRKAAIDICQKAVTEAGTNSYDADMQAIVDKVKTYPYGKKVDGTTLMMRCTDGAYILETWSIYKYGVYGYISPTSHNIEDSDVDFWPENNPYSARASWHAQGSK